MRAVSVKGLFLAFGLLLLCCRCAEAAPAVVQGCLNGVTGNGGTITCTFGAGTTAGSAVCGVASWDDAGMSATMTDVSGGGTFTIEDQQNNANGQPTGIFCLANITAGTTVITVTFSASVAFRTIAAVEISGIVASAPEDGHKIGTFQTSVATTTDAITSTSITTAVNGDAILAFTINTNGTRTASAGTGFSIVASASSVTTPNSVRTEFLVQSSAGSIAGTFTAGTSAGNWQTGIVAIKAVGGGGGASSGMLLMGVGK